MLSLITVTSRVISSQSINGRTGNRFVIHALQSSVHFICKEVSETVDLALLLYSKNVITSEQLDPVIESLGKKGQDPLKKIQNYKLLRIVEANVSKDPRKIYDLCAAFEEQNLQQCSRKLQGTTNQLQIKETMHARDSQLCSSKVTLLIMGCSWKTRCPWCVTRALTTSLQLHCVTRILQAPAHSLDLR